MICFIRMLDVWLLFITLTHLYKCTNTFLNIDNTYHLVSESYNMASSIFTLGRNNYNGLKNRSLHAMDTFLDLVHLMNNEMGKELRSSIIKFYKIKYFQDFTNYVITLEEMVDVIEHCLVSPEEKIIQIRSQFHNMIKNFEDVRNFETVYKCKHELPDEVAVAHCILHQAVLFNETMQDSLISIVEIKTRQYARSINASMYEVQDCLNNLVPNFFEQLLVESYTDRCRFLKIVNASIVDLAKDGWRTAQDTVFAKKWSPVVGILQYRSKLPKVAEQPLFLALLAANLTSLDVFKTFYPEIN